MGQAVGAEERTKGLVERLAQEIAAWEAKVLGRPRKSAAFLYLLSPDSPPFAAGQGIPEHEPLLRAGGEDVSGEVGTTPGERGGAPPP